MGASHIKPAPEDVDLKREALRYSIAEMQLDSSSVGMRLTDPGTKTNGGEVTSTGQGINLH